MVVREYLRSDNGSEFTATRIREWLRDVNVITLYIDPGSPWENGYCESFNSKMRDEFLNLEIFDTMFEAQVLTKKWVETYNTIRPHSSHWVQAACSAGTKRLCLDSLSICGQVFGGWPCELQNQNREWWRAAVHKAPH